MRFGFRFISRTGTRAHAMRSAAAKILSLIAAGLIAGLPPSAANADLPAPSHQECSRAVRVAASPIGRSMMVSATGVVSGNVVDFLSLVARQSGCKFQYIVVPRTRAFLMLATGAVDIVPSVNRTEERDRWGTFIHLYSTRPMLMSLDGRIPASISFNELVNSRITLGVVRGYNYGPAYMAMLNEPALQTRISQVPDPDTIARMLLAGRMDAGMMTPAAFVAAAEAANIADRVVVTPVAGIPASPAGMYINGKKLPAEDGKKIMDAITTLARRGEYTRLLRQSYASPKWAINGMETGPFDAGDSK